MGNKKAHPTVKIFIV